MAADFFDKLGEGIVTVGKEIAGKTKEVAEISKLHASIAAEEVKIKEHYYQIGKLYYERFKDVPDLEFLDEIDRINESNAKIQSMREALNREEKDTKEDK